MNNQLITDMLAVADAAGQTSENIVNVTPFVIVAVVLALLYVLWKIHKKIKLKRKINTLSKNIAPSLENATIEEMDSALKRIYDEIGMNAIKKTQRVMKEELEKSLGEYKDDDTYMLPEEKARQILLEMIRLAVVQRNDMINQFIHSTEAGKIYSVIDHLIDEIDTYENDAFSKLRIKKEALKEKTNAEIMLEALKNQSIRKGKEQSMPSKGERENQKTDEHQMEEQFNKDVQDSQ